MKFKIRMKRQQKIQQEQISTHPERLEEFQATIFAEQIIE